MSEPHNSFRFTNEHGERWTVVIDPVTGTGILGGDETDWEPVRIREGVIDGGWGLSQEEFDWLASVWLQATGQRLQGRGSTGSTC